MRFRIGFNRLFYNVFKILDVFKVTPHWREHTNCWDEMWERRMDASIGHRARPQ
jgi:hypothetical protein